MVSDIENIPSITFGLEVEYHVINDKGEISNRAEQVLKNTGRLGEGFGKEPGKSLLEVYTDKVANDVQNLAENMVSNLETIVSVAEQDNLALHPGNSYAGFKPEINVVGNESYEKLVWLMGEYHFNLCGDFAGIHMHFGRDVDNETLLYKALVEALPSAAILSSSPFYEGRQELNSHRMKLWDERTKMHFKNENFNLYKLLAGSETPENRVEAIYLMLKESVGPENMPEEWGVYRAARNPLAVRENTFEYRRPDTNLITNAVSFAALLVGYTRSVLANDELVYNLSQESLDDLIKKGEKFGLGTPEVQRYCSIMVDVAAKYLLPEEKKYLSFVEKMVQDRETFSDKIITQSVREGYLDKVGSLQSGAEKDLRLWVANQNREALDKIRDF